jgi:hypothetical protein
VLWREARCSSSSCSLDSSVQREVHLHRRVVRRIDVPPSSGYVYHSCDWKILSDPLDQEVHRERSGQTIFINASRDPPAPPPGVVGPWPPSGSPSVFVSRLGKIGGSGFVSSNFENISCVTFLKHKSNRKQGTGTVASRQ